MTAPNDKLPPDDQPGDGPTEELVAYLDGELDAKASEAFATKLSLDAKLRAEADSLQRAWDILDILPKPAPSVSFTTKTISQAIPISGSQPTLLTTVPSGSRPTMAAPVLPAPRSGVGFWIAASVVVLLAGAGGYLGHALLAPPKGERDLDAQMQIKDLSLLKNARLFHHVDDMEYLKQLDSPELFGDEGE